MFKTLYQRSILTIAFLGMLGLVVMTSMQVVARYVFQASMFWPEEMARSLLIVMTFVLAGESYRRGELVSATFFAAAFGPAVAAIFEIVSLLFSIALMVVLVYLGVEYAWMNNTQLLAAMQIPAGWIYAAVPVGCLLLLGQLLAAIWVRLRSLANRRGV